MPPKCTNRSRKEGRAGAQGWESKDIVYRGCEMSRSRTAPEITQGCPPFNSNVRQALGLDPTRKPFTADKKYGKTIGIWDKIYPNGHPLGKTRANPKVKLAWNGNRTSRF